MVNDLRAPQLQRNGDWEGVKVWKGEPFERAMTDYLPGRALPDERTTTAMPGGVSDSAVFAARKRQQDDLDITKLVRVALRPGAISARVLQPCGWPDGPTS